MKRKGRSTKAKRKRRMGVQGGVPLSPIERKGTGKDECKNRTHGIPPERRRLNLATRTCNQTENQKIRRSKIGFKGSATVTFASDTSSAEDTNLPNERNKQTSGPRKIQFSHPYSRSKIVHTRCAGEFETSI